MQSDKERIDWLEKMTHEGYAPVICFDDDGHWAVTFSGFQPCPDGDGAGYSEEVVVSGCVEVHQWKPTLREAIDFAHQTEIEERAQQ